MLNKNILSKHSAKKVVSAVILFISLISLTCGKRKPPLPPIEKISQRAEINGIQRGNAITISWTLPQNNALSESILKISRVDIYRLAEPLTAALTLSEEEFASRSTLISTIAVSESDIVSKQLSYTDILEFAGQSARLRYAIRFVNESGQKAVFSNFLLIEPTAKVAANPTSLSVKSFQETVKVFWKSPVSNIDGSIPANIIGYNVYKIVGDSESSKTINNSPITGNEFDDNFFEFGKEYKYFVRAISLGSNGEPVESLDSNVIEVIPKDTFAPSPPSAITIAAAPNNLSIFFAVNPEKDIAGYKIYRSTNPNQSKADWMLLTPTLLNANTFQDKNVESGKIYYYYLIAVDTAENISVPSEIVSETAP